MLFVLRDLGLSASLVGIIVSMGGVSALGGARRAKTISRWLGFGPAIVVTFAIGMVGSALLLPAALFPNTGRRSCSCNSWSAMAPSWRT
jgi:hypothetical protein